MFSDQKLEHQVSVIETGCNPDDSYDFGVTMPQSLSGIETQTVLIAILVALAIL
jgi:hypothetical protein